MVCCVFPLTSHRNHSIGQTNVFVVSTKDVDKDLAAMWTAGNWMHDDAVVGDKETVPFVKDIWIHLGVYQGIKNIHLETTAYNDMTFRCPDECGFQPAFGTRVNENDKALKRTTQIPVESICTEDSLANLVKLSTDPGRFLCNYVYFKSLSRISEMMTDESNCDAMFIHVPDFSDMSFATQVKLLSHILHYIAQTVVRSKYNEGPK